MPREREPDRSYILYDLGLKDTLPPFTQHATGQGSHNPPPAQVPGKRKRLHLSVGGGSVTPQEAHTGVDARVGAIFGIFFGTCNLPQRSSTHGT